MVGFDDVGQKDDFTTDVLERRILKSGVIAKVGKNRQLRPSANIVVCISLF